MKITLNKTVVNNRFATEVGTAFPEQEDDLITAFGDPEVNFGGSFTGPPAFTLADNYRNLKAGMPTSFGIDGNGDAEAKDKMIVWNVEMRVRLLAAMNTLRTQTDDYSGELIETV